MQLQRLREAGVSEWSMRCSFQEGWGCCGETGVTSRKRLTKYEYAVLFLEQRGKCGCGCGERLEAGQVDEEHSIPVAFDGPEKPDSLWRRDCHKRKTKKDVKAIAKTNRIIRKSKGEWRTNRKKIQSRGFNKDLTRGFDGKVKERK